MTVKNKVEIKHKRLNYNITLLAEFIDIYKDNTYLLTASPNKDEMCSVYEKSYWIMLDFNIFIGSYFSDGSKNFYKEDRMHFYDDKNKQLEESIDYCSNLMNSRLIGLIEEFFRKYKDELLQDGIENISQAEVLKNIKIYKNIESGKSDKEKLRSLSYLIKVYNTYLENEPYLISLKSSNRKRNWIIPITIASIMGVVMVLLGIWIGSNIQQDNDYSEKNIKDIIFSLINKDTNKSTSP